MLNTLRRRMAKEEEGFTLIELMVVILIIAILMAIAIPTFLGAQKRAQDRGAQSNLRNALTAAKTIATDNSGTFMNGAAAITDVDMDNTEKSLDFVADAAFADTVGPIAVEAEAAGGSIILYNKSASGDYFCIAAKSDGTVGYGKPATAAAAAALVAPAAAVALPAGCNSAKW